MTTECRICVRGRIDKAWSDYLGGLTITVENGEDGAAVTILSGLVADEVVLLGILERLLGLDVAFLSVEFGPVR